MKMKSWKRSSVMLAVSGSLIVAFAFTAGIEFLTPTCALGGLCSQVPVIVPTATFWLAIFPGIALLSASLMLVLTEVTRKERTRTLVI
jgi:ABC-type dipeptide/oligopeptide/nickel transport system permease subunit